jgi:DNA recombination protein RmuC
MELFLLAACFFGGGALGWFLGVRSLNQQRASDQKALLELTRRASALEANDINFRVRLGELVPKYEGVVQQLGTAHQELAAALSSRQHLEERLNAQANFMEDFQKRTKSEFENLANQILDTKSKTFAEQSEKNLLTLLTPLKERITTFEKKVDDSYNNEAKERFALKAEVERLILLNDRMTKETTNLTQALKGDSKFQGDWGELVLEKILEASGLRAGFEYQLQGEHKDSEGGSFRPDVIVNLPDSKHIIIDSKVSLKAYELHCRTDDGEQRLLYLNQHLKSTQKHIEDLSAKHYARLKGINSPEFVFLFMPIEPAYLLVMQNDPEISVRAWRKGVALVTSTTLFTSLKTVASIWKLENQNKNALEIAHEGAKLYDKFVGFFEDFEKIGKIFDSGQSQFTAAMSKLKEGPGNVFRKMELLRELGAAPKNRLRPELTEQ